MSVNFPGWGPSPWQGVGDTTFRNVGADRAPAEPRTGFRIFAIYNKAERRNHALPGGKVLRGPMRLVNDPMNGTLTGPIHTEYHYGPGWNVATCANRVRYRNPADDHTTAPHILTDGTPHGCGFYAYGATDHKDADPDRVPVNRYTGGRPMFVHSVVEMSGFRVLGTKGCLAERLRIVAIVLPSLCGSSRGSSFTDGEDAYDQFAPQVERLVMARYPDVLVYDSVEQMVAEHPLTPLPSRDESAA